jgi:hypothetical protein
LCHDTSGRWRIVATGFRFTEVDERRAIDRFRRLQPAPGVEHIAIPSPSIHAALDEMVLEQSKIEAGGINQPIAGIQWNSDTGEVNRGYKLDPKMYWFSQNWRKSVRVQATLGLG